MSAALLSANLTYLRPKAVRLLKVIADDLVIGASRLLEPGGEVLVKLGPPLFRCSAVSSVSDEDVTEPERVFTREGGTLRLDKAPSHKSLK
jgi:hypothetical protein